MHSLSRLTSIEVVAIICFPDILYCAGAEKKIYKTTQNQEEYLNRYNFYSARIGELSQKYESPGNQINRRKLKSDTIDASVIE